MADMIITFKEKSSTLRLDSTLPLSYRHKRQNYVTGLTTPLNNSSQKALLRVQQGRWVGSLHSVNTSAVVQGVTFLSDCLDTCTHISRVAPSSCPQILYPITPGTKLGLKNLCKRIMSQYWVGANWSTSTGWAENGLKTARRRRT